MCREMVEYVGATETTRVAIEVGRIVDSVTGHSGYEKGSGIKERISNNDAVGGITGFISASRYTEYLVSVVPTCRVD